MLNSLSSAPLSVDRRLSSVSFYSYLLVLALAGALLGSLYIKDNHLWLDEVFSMILLEDPSFLHMNEAVSSGIETNPPLFFCLYWLLGHYVSLDPFVLKLTSVVLFLGTIVLFFRYVNQLIRNPALNFLIFITILSLTYLNYVQSGQIRSYSLYLLMSSLYFIAIHKLINEPAKPLLLIWQMLTGVALMFIHNYGLFLVSIPASVFVILFFWSKRRDYLFPLLSVVLIFATWALIWFDDFQVQSQASKPHFWIQKPTFLSFFQTIGDLIPTVVKLEASWPLLAMVRVLAVAGLFIYILVKQFNFQKLVNDSAFSFYVLSGYIFILVSLAALVVSVFYVPILINRYLWPLHLLLIYQFIYAIQYFKPQFRILPRYTFFVVIYTLILSTSLFLKNKSYSAFPGKAAEALKQLPHPYPVFCESVYNFLPLDYYHVGNVRFWLDWDTSIASKKTAEYKAVKLFRDKYPMRAVVSPEQFTKQNYPRFYVLDETKTYKFEDLINKGKIQIVRTMPTSMGEVRILECIFR